MNSSLLAKAQAFLEEHWGYKHFREDQIPIIELVLNKKDTIAILPTGGGKSICFQVPALCIGGMCLVITPLIALMNDQVNTLRKKKINAQAIHSGISLSAIESVWKQCELGWISFLYVSPEKIQSDRFLEHLAISPPSLIAVDEAHCISQWGFDFRPSYLKIQLLRECFPEVPVIALTATATKKVEKDIATYLKLKHPSVLRSNITRKNLAYQVKKNLNPHASIASYLKQHPNAHSIVYAQTRKECQTLSALLNRNGINSTYYHAGLPSKERTSKEKAFLSGQITSIVATSAFGMGIDKPNVRSVIHTHIPESIENYYQQAGRAGRDGNPSSCILYYNEHLLTSLEKNIEREFPSTRFINKIYEKLISYCTSLDNMCTTTNTPNVYRIDISTFASRVRSPIHSIHRAIRHIEQQELVKLDEYQTQETTCHFIVSSDIIKQHLTLYPQQKKIVTYLLRTVPGILTEVVIIQPSKIAAICEISENELHRTLTVLVQCGLMNYTPSSNVSTIKLLQPEMKFNKTLYENLKKIKLRNTQHISHYVTETRKCRQSIFSDYFNSKQTTACNNCDNCTTHQRSKKEEDAAILSYIKNTLQGAPQKINYLMHNAPTLLSQQRVLEHIKQLEEKEIIAMNPNSLQLEWKK